MTLVSALGTILGAALLSGIFSCVITLVTIHHQKKSDDLAYKRATADRKRMELYSAYKVMHQLVGNYERLLLAIEGNLEEDSIQVAQSALDNSIKEAEEAQTAYMLIDKEDDIYKSLKALNISFISWRSTRKIFDSLQNSINPIMDPLTMMPYETVKKAREQFEAKRDAFLTCTKAWERDLQ